MPLGNVMCRSVYSTVEVRMCMYAGLIGRVQVVPAAKPQRFWHSRCAQAGVPGVPGGTVQFVLKPCCHDSIASGAQVKRMKSSLGIYALCAAICYLQVESDEWTVQEESFCK